MKNIDVRVFTADAELEFSVTSTTTGKQLFDQVVKTIGLREIWYFGLEYTDTSGFITFLKLNKKLAKQDVEKDNGGILNFRFRAKFYPENVDEVIQDFTLRLFYLQVKDLVLTDEIFCPPDNAVFLASYAMQVKYGDHDQEKHKSGFLATDRLLPARVVSQFRSDAEDWETRITEFWSCHKGKNREQAMLDYLKNAQDLDMYGINYFEIRNKKGTELYLGVDALGISMYDKNDKLTPKVGFPWSEVKNISFNGKKFVIKPIGHESNDFIFFAPRMRINKKILDLCMGNHELYMRRRRPDTIDVQQMKQQVQEERKQRAQEQERLAAAEQKQREYEANMKNMKEEMDRQQREIKKAHETIYRLEQLNKELHLAKVELEQKEHELIELNERLQSEKVMSEEERHRLVKEIANREVQLVDMRSQVELKNIEVQKSRNELPSVHTYHGFVGLREQMDTKSVESASDTDDLTHGFAELSVEDDAFVTCNQPELDRVLTMNKNSEIKNKLSKLSKELENVKALAKVTGFDRIHFRNRRENRDRYKTLTVICAGNTQRRVEQFEKM